MKRLVSCVLAVALTSGLPLRVEAQARRPRLIVLLMVDQMRADYIDKFQHQWTAGLRRLIAEGAWFREADYPYAATVTCGGHASVSTGTLPSVHGMIGNTWWDRERGAVVACADDPTVYNLSFGKPVDAAGESAVRLLAPTLADELRAQLSPVPRIVAFSLKARSAVTLGGQRPDAVAWVDDQGAFVTSSAFAGGPSPAVADYVARHPVEHQLWSTWDRALPDSAYLYEDLAGGARDGDAPSFPRTIRTWVDWQASPLADEYLVDMALDVGAQMKLGAAGRTDMLAIGFSTLDIVGHASGPNSHEVQDVLVRLDRTIGRLLAGLDRQVGRGNYVVALSADHGVAPVPERSEAFGLDAARIPVRAIPDAAQQAIAAQLGRGQYVNRLMSDNLYLADDVYDMLRSRPGALAAVRTAIESVPGVRAVYSRDQLMAGAFGDDALARQFANSFMPSRSGDFVIAYKPYWLFGGTGGTTHGTPYRYDTHVPVILMGPGIAPGEYARSVTPLDIAPTLAYLAGITLPYAHGQVLTDALRRPEAALTTRGTTPAPRPVPPAPAAGR